MTYEIDLSTVRDREGFHDIIEKTLPVPEYYGRTLDSLYDVLTSKLQNDFIVVRGSEAFSEYEWDYFNLFEMVLKDSKVHFDIIKGEEDE